MPTNLETGELSIHKAEHDIDQHIDHLSNSLDDLAEKLEVPVMKVQSVKDNLKKIQNAPWGLIAVGGAFFIGFMTTRKMR
jgi:hypothetical protein